MTHHGDRVLLRQESGDHPDPVAQLREARLGAEKCELELQDEQVKALRLFVLGIELRGEPRDLLRKLSESIRCQCYPRFGSCVLLNQAPMRPYDEVTGVDRTHNPEFTQLEFYWAYADYLKVMDLTEQMIRFAAERVLGKHELQYLDHTIRLGAPWQRMELNEGLLEVTGIDIDQHPTAESLASAMRAKGMEPNPNDTRGKLIDGLLGDYLAPTLIQPTFVYNYPRDISPLAKSLPGNPQITERFEGYLAGMELCNAFTELNDPLDQEARFVEMGRDYAQDDEERHPMDEDYLRAMRYGMPPCGGFGMGVDRLAMLFTNSPNIREVILFPHLRKEEE